MSPSGEDFEFLRQKMIKGQLLSRNIRDEKVLEAFNRVQRHRFVDPAMYADAYSDSPLAIGKGQTISQPYIVALMMQLLGIKDKDKILEIGTGSGYETALLAELTDRVFSVERIESLSEKAKRILKELGYDKVRIKTGDGTMGWPEFSPFDKIVVTAASDRTPASLLNQLSGGGKMVMPVGTRFSQRLMLMEKDLKGNISEKNICGCVFVPLIGKYGQEDGFAGKNT